MSDHLMHDGSIGQFFSRNARYGRRFLDEEWTGKVYVVRGRRYIKESDLLQWIENRKVETPLQSEPTSVKTMLRSISDRVLQQRKKSA